MPYAIEIRDLKKNYGGRQVLKGVNFCVNRGEILGILGVNGAGKTTLLECIEGFRKCSSGEIKIDGSTGVQLQSAALPAYMKVGEAMCLFAKWKKSEAGGALLEALGIAGLKKKRYGELSAGQKRRVQLAAALIGKPEILLLDEPAAELDIEGRCALHDEIRRLSRNGTTILLSSHDMAEVEALCNRIAVLHNGRICFLGTTDEFAARTGRKYTIKIVSGQGKREYSAENIAGTLMDILEEYRRKQIAIFDIRVSRGTLEQHFIQFSKEGKENEGFAVRNRSAAENRYSQ